VSQQEIDNFFKHLEENPPEMERMKAMVTEEIVNYAERLGYTFDTEELEARQALVHLFNGT